MVEAGRDAYSAGRDIVFASSPQARAQADDFARLSPSVAADGLTELGHHQQVGILAAMSPKSAAAVLHVLLRRKREDVVVTLLADIHPDTAVEVTHVLIRLEPDRQWIEDIPEAAAAVRKCADEADPELGKAVDGLGREGPERGWHCGGFRQRYERGTVYWSKPVGAHATTGKLEELYRSYGGSGGLLWFPISSEEGTPGGGRRQAFEGGTLYWSGKPEDSAYPELLPIGKRYSQSGGFGGELGYPISGPTEVRHDKTGVKGSCQRFERGVIYSIGADAIIVPLKIAGYHDTHGGVSGQMGFPISEYGQAITSLYGTVGWYQRFMWEEPYPADVLAHYMYDHSKFGGKSGGTVYISDQGVFSVSSSIGAFYERQGGTTGPLGFPTSDEDNGRIVDGVPAFRYQSFEGGVVYSKGARGVVGVSIPLAGSCHQVLAWRRGSAFRSPRRSHSARAARCSSLSAAW